ncbi:MAG: hypothetical protein WBC59_10245 [Phycisphaerae bacterium]
MRQRRVAHLGLWLLVTLIVSGCGGSLWQKRQVVEFYTGPRLPDDKVATLHCHGRFHLKIDGKILEAKSGEYLQSNLSVRMLPGTHEIEWATPFPVKEYFSTGGGSFDAKAGKTYHLHSRSSSPDMGGGLAIYKLPCWIEEAETGEVLVGQRD